MDTTIVYSQEKNENLLKQYHSGNVEVLEEIICNNIPLINSIVRKFKVSDFEKEDLFQIGCMALVRAINRFELDKGVMFSTYAFPLIYGDIKKYLRDNNTIKISRQLKELSFKIYRESLRLSQLKDAEVSAEELSAVLNVPVETILEANRATQETVSLNNFILEDSSSDLASIIDCEEEDDYDKLIERDTLNNIIAALSDKEFQIINLRYFRNKTQKEVADLMTLSQAQVSRLEKTILDKMKRAMIV